MNKIMKTAAALSLGACSYVSPEVMVTEIDSEGILCASLNVIPWEDEEELNW